RCGLSHAPLSRAASRSENISFWPPRIIALLILIIRCVRGKRSRWVFGRASAVGGLASLAGLECAFEALTSWAFLRGSGPRRSSFIPPFIPSFIPSFTQSCLPSCSPFCMKDRHERLVAQGTPHSLFSAPLVVAAP